MPKLCDLFCLYSGINVLKSKTRTFFRFPSITENRSLIKSNIINPVTEVRRKLLSDKSLGDTISETNL